MKVEVGAVSTGSGYYSRPKEKEQARDFSLSGVPVIRSYSAVEKLEKKDNLTHFRKTFRPMQNPT
jgi:hypothetical protein